MSFLKPSIPYRGLDLETCTSFPTPTEMEHRPLGCPERSLRNSFETEYSVSNPLSVQPELHSYSNTSPKQTPYFGKEMPST